jgi:hypothetical protein
MRENGFFSPLWGGFTLHKVGSNMDRHVSRVDVLLKSQWHDGHIFAWLDVNNYVYGNFKFGSWSMNTLFALLALSVKAAIIE